MPAGSAPAVLCCHRWDPAGFRGDDVAGCDAGVKEKRPVMPVFSYFSRKFSASEGSASLKLSPNAQMILFFLIYNEKADYTKKELAERLGLDPVYVTRGTKELVSRGFIEERRNGRSVEVRREIDSRELFHAAETALISPVSGVVFVRKTDEVTRLPKASDHALSEVSMLNPPEIYTYACFRKSGLAYDLEIVDEPGWEDPSGICKVELWNYDPAELCENGIVDRLSLYCSLKDSKDPRVQGEIEKVLEDMTWQ